MPPPIRNAGLAPRACQILYSKAYTFKPPPWPIHREGAAQRPAYEPGRFAGRQLRDRTAKPSERSAEPSQQEQADKIAHQSAASVGNYDQRMGAICRYRNPGAAWRFEIHLVPPI